MTTTVIAYHYSSDNEDAMKLANKFENATLLCLNEEQLEDMKLDDVDLIMFNTSYLINDFDILAYKAKSLRVINTKSQLHKTLWLDSQDNLARCFYTLNIRGLVMRLNLLKDTSSEFNLSEDDLTYIHTKDFGDALKMLTH